jgi:hypothetical protein
MEMFRFKKNKRATQLNAFRFLGWLCQPAIRLARLTTKFSSAAISLMSDAD